MPYKVIKHLCYFKAFCLVTKTDIYIKFSRNTVLDVNISFSSGSQLAIDSDKAKKLANGSVNYKEDASNALVKLIRQNSCCSICRKCISEKKKLIAHKKLCMMKYKQKLKKNNNKKNKSPDNLSDEYGDHSYEVDDEDDELLSEFVDNEIMDIKSINNNSAKKQKTNNHLIIDPNFFNSKIKNKSNEKQFESNQTNNTSKNEDSINNFFLFE